MALRKVINRRRWLEGAGSLAASFGVIGTRARSAGAPLRFALTPVLLTSDLGMLEVLKDYLAHAMNRPVHLVSRRTYQEITALLVTRQVDAAWICGYPFVAYRKELALVAVPVWRGQPLYQSYLIGRADQKAETLADLAGTVHAFSDPDWPVARHRASRAGCRLSARKKRRRLGPGASPAKSRLH